MKFVAKEVYDYLKKERRLFGKNLITTCDKYIANILAKTPTFVNL